jgi:hypothetical protein
MDEANMAIHEANAMISAMGWDVWGNLTIKSRQHLAMVQDFLAFLATVVFYPDTFSRHVIQTR